MLNPFLFQIKQRVTKAASEGLSQIAHGMQLSQTCPITSTPISSLNRRSSIWDFSDEDLFPLHKLNYAPDIPTSSQEYIILNELIHSLVGIRGQYIVPDEKTIRGFEAIKFNISDKIDPSIRDIAQEV